METGGDGRKRCPLGFRMIPSSIVTINVVDTISGVFACHLKKKRTPLVLDVFSVSLSIFRRKTLISTEFSHHMDIIGLAKEVLTELTHNKINGKVANFDGISPPALT